MKSTPDIHCAHCQRQILAAELARECPSCGSCPLCEFCYAQHQLDEARRKTEEFEW